jgi:electron transfer flavoprotein alpha/beta subunit
LQLKRDFVKKKKIKLIFYIFLDFINHLPLQVVKVTAPPKRKAGVIVSSVDELIDKLRNEAHVI